MECVKADGTVETSVKIMEWLEVKEGKNISTFSYDTSLYYWVDERKYVRCSRFAPAGCKVVKL